MAVLKTNYTVATNRMLNAHRIIAGTFINNDTNEEVVVNLLAYDY